MKIIKMIKKISDKIKSCLLLTGAFITLFATYATPVFAEGNSLMDSAPVKGLIRFLNDATMVLTFVSPIIGGLLIGLFSIILGAQDDAQDKAKWKKNRTTVIIALCWTFGASAVVAIITTYVKG